LLDFRAPLPRGAPLLSFNCGEKFISVDLFAPCAETFTNYVFLHSQVQISQSSISIIVAHFTMLLVLYFGK
jgi:hypothetical protein